MGNRYDGSMVTVTTVGATITTSGTSASATIPNASSGEKPRYVRICASAAACVRMNKTAATATTADTMVQPGDSVIMAVPLGYDTIAAIQVSATGSVQVSPLENM